MKTTKRKPRSWILTLVFSAAVLAYIFFIFVPTQRSIAELRKGLEQQRQYVVQADLEYVSYGQLENELMQVEQYLEQWRDASPSERDLPVLLGNVSQIAAASGVTMRRMNPGESVELASVSQHSFQFDVEGSFSELFEFFRQLEGLSGIIWSNQLQLQRNGKSDKRLQCKLDLTVFTDNPDNSD